MKKIFVNKGFTYTGQGYVLLTRPEHPNADRWGHIPEHRYVMSNHLGRPLRRHESVHHINGDRTDNRICNLELWSSWHPSGQRVSDKVKWAKQVLTAYAPHVLRKTGEVP